MENLRKTMEAIINNKVDLVFENLSQEDKNKVNDLIYFSTCATCTGGDVTEVEKNFKEIAKICDIDISFELDLLNIDIKEALDKIESDVQVEDNNESSKEIEEEIEVEGDSKEVEKESTNNIQNKELTVFDDFISKVNKELNASEIYKNTLASLTELNANNSDIINLRQAYEQEENKEAIDLISAILFIGFDKYIMENKDKLKDVNLESEEQILMFLSSYAIHLNGIQPVIDAFKSNLFTLTEIFEDDGTPIYKIMGIEVRKEIRDNILTNIDNIVNQFILEVRNITGPTDEAALNLLHNKIDKLIASIQSNCLISLGLKPRLFGSDAPTPETAFTNPSFSFDNTEILNKFPKLKAIEEIYHTNKLDVKIKEIRPNSSFIEFLPYFITNDRESDRKIYVDLGGNLFDRTEKAFLFDNTQTCIEDCVAVKLSNTQAIREFILNGMSSEVKAYDEISDELKAMNKIIDIATLPKNNNNDKNNIISIINSDTCQEKINECINKDPNSRFKLADYKDANNFSLISDNSVSQSILERGPKKIKKYKIVVKNKVSTLILMDTKRGEH